MALSDDANHDPLLIAQEMALCAADPRYFIINYCKIKMRRDDGSFAITPFLLWPYQVAIITALFQGGHFMFLKARQLGITTVICSGWIIWLALFRENSTILMMSQRKEDAEDLLDRVATTYDYLPIWMRQRIKPGGKKNLMEMNFSNGSAVYSQASTGKSGRSRTASLVFIDEADYLDDLKATYNAVKPTVDGPGGQLIMASTSQGPLRYWKTLWDIARKKQTKLVGVFLPWQVRPGRTQEWYDQETSTMPDHERKREYPATWRDCFTSADALVYPDFDEVKHMEEMRYDPKTGRIYTRRYGSYRPSLWIAGIDFNIAQPGAMIVGCLTDDGTVILIDGHYEAGVPVVTENKKDHTWSNIAKALHKKYPFSRLMCDHDPDNISALCRHGLPAIKATKDVSAGIALVTGALKSERKDGAPMFLCSDSLSFVALEMQQYKRRSAHDGQVLDAVVKQYDHALDATRYMMQELLRGGPKISVW